MQIKSWITAIAAGAALLAQGKAARIYDTWFGPNSATPLPRNFKIGDPT